MVKLLSGQEAAIHFGINECTFSRYRHKIIANHGLKCIQVGKSTKYSSEDVERIIRSVTKSGKPLYTLERGRNANTKSSKTEVVVVS